MQLTAAQIKYLLAVYGLRQFGIVRLTDVALRMHVSKPSVHRMLGQLKERGLIAQIRKGVTELTLEGEEAARRYASWFRIIYSFYHRELQMTSGAAQENTAALLGTNGESVRELCQRIEEYEKQAGGEAG